MKTILSISLSGVLDYMVIPLMFILFCVAMYKLLLNKKRISPKDDDPENEEGIK